MNGHHLENYVVGFFDLLGQREAMRGEGLLKRPHTPPEKETFKAKFMASIGAILDLQTQSDRMLSAVLQKNRKSPFRKSLSCRQRRIWDAMQACTVSTQRWSDGLVHFMSLKRGVNQCPMTGVFSIFVSAGLLCLIGLASQRPVRGAIEIAWGIELHRGELYGPAVARAYELESEVAQYPRIIVGKETIQYLKLQEQNAQKDPFSQYSRSLAALCLGNR